VAVIAKTVNDPPGQAKLARLDFRLHPSVPTVLDGAWWPRSRDAVAELADLVIALDAEQTQVSLIMLNPGDWQSHPRRIEAGGRSVRVVWIGDLDPTVLIARTTYERVDLLMLFDDDDTVASTSCP
jgi:hypothetical protein